MTIFDPDNPEAVLSQLTDQEAREVSEFYAASKRVDFSDDKASSKATSDEQLLWNRLREAHPDWKGHRIRML